MAYIPADSLVDSLPEVGRVGRHFHTGARVNTPTPGCFAKHAKGTHGLGNPNLASSL